MGGNIILKGADISQGSLSYLDAGGEQTVVTISPTAPLTIEAAWIDLTTLTLDGYVRTYYKVDGTNYRLQASELFTHGTSPDCHLIQGPFGIQNDFKITYEESADEGAARALPWEVIFK